LIDFSYFNYYNLLNEM